ncbi:uncharacterized protein [Henckelia pumila]|uniref:uncharacterized protein n=1 Tax=Henckelia pumila TaxID=405737 RepID=UPI003C6E0059
MEKQSAFCFPCYIFDNNSAQFDTFTVKGFKNWKRVNCKNCQFRRHEGDDNSRHAFAMRKWGEMKNVDQHIDRRMEKQCSKEIQQNRLLLKVSIESVKFLAMQGCAFRGHDESVESVNRGNYIELMKLLGRINPHVGEIILKTAAKNAKYTSPTIQKEILQIIADILRDKIHEEIGDAKFCILVDEALDESNREQMAVILRYVDRNGFIRERFFEVVNVENTNALTLKKEIFSKEVHDVWRFFSTLSTIVNFVSASSKRHFQLKSIREAEVIDLIASGEVETGTGANQVLGVPDMLCQKLQKDNIDILSVMDLVSTTKLVLQQIQNDRWKSFLLTVIEFCEYNDVDVPDLENRYMKDFQLMKLNDRFSERTVELLTLSNSLNPVDGFKSFSPSAVCSLVDKFYHKDFNKEEREYLERQLDHYKFDVPHHERFQKLDSLPHLCHILVATSKSQIYPLIDRLIRLVLTLPISTATTERAFSGMKLIKTSLRNKMYNEFLTNTMVIFIEREIATTIDTEFVIDKFDILKNRKLRLK